MLTPVFDLTQDDNFLIASIRVPYAKISDAEVHFEDFEFKFFCKPYFLKLNLPGKILYTEDPAVTYNADTGTMVIQMPKATPKEVFEDLDLITKLLAPKKAITNTIPQIEVIGESLCSEEQDFNWELEQPINDENEENSINLNEKKCGFANKYTCSVFKLKEETTEIFDITNPETKSNFTRTEERVLSETNYFCDDYYLDNLYHDEDIQQLLSFTPEWENFYEQAICDSNNFNKTVHFTSEEKERLRRLPNKEYLLENNEIKSVFLGLTDILFAYAYNLRTCMGEHTVESAWTINKISVTLSNLETFSSLKEAIVCPMRRSLCYPLFRHWELTCTVLNDMIKILTLGQKYVLKCFLEIHELFCQSDPRYILNDLYITDYCVWIQGKICRSKTLRTIAETLKKLQISKDDMNLDLTELEWGAKLALKDSEGKENVQSLSDDKNE